MAKQTNPVDISTENTETTGVANDPIGTLEEALEKRIVELEVQIKTLEAEIVIHKNVAKEQAEEIEALKAIQATQDEVLAGATSTENEEEILRYKLAKQGLTLVVIEGERYATGNASLGGVPINDVEPEKLQELLELGTFFEKV